MDQTAIFVLLGVNNAFPLSYLEEFSTVPHCPTEVEVLTPDKLGHIHFFLNFTLVITYKVKFYQVKVWLMVNRTYNNSWKE